jgi:flagellin
MTVINTNSASIMAQYNLSKSNSTLETAMAQLSSGKRINAASDDAAGISQVTRMEAQIVGLNQAVRNASEGMTLVDTAEGSMGEMRNMLLRMRELAVQSSTATYNDTDRANLNIEVEQLKSELDRVVDTTRFNGKLLLDGSFQGNLQIGANAGEVLNVAINNMSTAALGSISGATSTAAITTASAKGVEATPTKTQLTFNGNDTYMFTIDIVTAAGTGTYVIEGDVTNNSAVDIAEKLNAAIRDTGGSGYVADGASTINVSYSGNVLTIENNYGGDIDIEQTASNPYGASGSTIGFTSVTGASNSDNLILGTASSFAATTFENANAYVAATPATVDLSESGTLTAGDVYEIELDDGAGNALTITPAAVGSGPAAGDGLTTILNAFNSLSDKMGYAMSITGGNLTVSREDGVDFTVALGAAAASNTGTVDESIGSAALSTTAVTTTSGVPAVGDPESNMYLEFTGPDTYSFTFGDGAATPLSTGSFNVTYDGSEASLTAIATVIGTKLNALSSVTNDFSVTAENGRIKITDADGQDFRISAFASTGSGKVMASVDIGQGATGNDGVLLDDTSFANTATTVGAGTPYETEMTLTFSADDRYSFVVSDGTASAVVGNFAADITSVGTTGDIAAEINTALQKAGLDSVMTATADASTEGVVTITHANGKEVTISNFRSDSTGVVQAEATGTNNTGFSKFLDDGDGAIQETIAGVSMLTAEDASASIEVIDRALEDITTERSTLGAVTNRLEHTVNNLGNIIINTETAQSKLEDADFAAVSTELATSQILSQAATAMLAQANASKQGVLSLLRG